jgi:hypothetical protein
LRATATTSEANAVVNRLGFSWIPALFVILLSLSGCGIYELPPDFVDDDIERADVNIHLSFDSSLPIYTTVDCDNISRSGTADTEHQLRYVVRIISNDTPKTLVYSMTFYRQCTDDLSTDVDIALPAGSYTALVWTDYVTATDDDDTPSAFYNAIDFGDVALTEIDHYVGSSDFRDAFRGEHTFVVSQTLHSVITDVNMTRPFAKYEIIATDVEKFAQQAHARSVNIGNDYHARIIYTGYLPTEFNLLTNKPIDAESGIWFDSDISSVTSTEAVLASDYVFVSSSESAVTAIVQIVDNSGVVVAQSPDIRIPLMRDELTEVHGQFLTASDLSGLSIDTQFSGEYNLEF